MAAGGAGLLLGWPRGSLTPRRWRARPMGRRGRGGTGRGPDREQVVARDGVRWPAVMRRLRCVCHVSTGVARFAVAGVRRCMWSQCNRKFRLNWRKFHLNCRASWTRQQCTLKFQLNWVRQPYLPASSNSIARRRESGDHIWPQCSRKQLNSPPKLSGNHIYGCRPAVGEQTGTA